MFSKFLNTMKCSSFWLLYIQTSERGIRTVSVLQYYLRLEMQMINQLINSSLMNHGLMWHIFTLKNSKNTDNIYITWLLIVHISIIFFKHSVGTIIGTFMGIFWPLQYLQVNWSSLPQNCWYDTNYLFKKTVQFIEIKLIIDNWLNTNIHIWDPAPVHIILLNKWICFCPSSRGFFSTCSLRTCWPVTVVPLLWFIRYMLEEVGVGLSQAVAVSLLMCFV